MRISIFFVFAVFAFEAFANMGFGYPAGPVVPKETITEAILSDSLQWNKLQASILEAKSKAATEQALKSQMQMDIAGLRAIEKNPMSDGKDRAIAADAIAKLKKQIREKVKLIDNAEATMSKLCNKQFMSSQNTYYKVPVADQKACAAKGFSCRDGEQPARMDFTGGRDFEPCGGGYSALGGYLGSPAGGMGCSPAANQAPLQSALVCLDKAGKIVVTAYYRSSDPVIVSERVTSTGKTTGLVETYSGTELIRTADYKEDRVITKSYMGGQVQSTCENKYYLPLEQGKIPGITNTPGRR
jgi:hypothetical protein